MDAYRPIDVSATPRLSIGLPVFNGERFLAQALNSLLGQSFADFELILSDNASTDGTPQICRYFAARDRRVRFYRSEENLGASANFNHVATMARGEYFKWAAHDDLCAPNYLKACIDVLDRHPDAIVCHTISCAIDEQAKRRGILTRDNGGFDSETPVERFEILLYRPHFCLAVFGVMRTKELLRTPLLAPYVGSDRNLLAELGLMGKIHIVPEVLFFRRDHADTSVARFTGNEKGWLAWLDPTIKEEPAFPTTRCIEEHSRALERVALLPEERERCRAVLQKWVEQGCDYQGRLVSAQLEKERSEREIMAVRQPAFGGERPAR
jgi:glycosyltransferase involved in cell wall biosynthesis